MATQGRTSDKGKWRVPYLAPYPLSSSTEFSKEANQAPEAVEVNLMTVTNVLGQGRQKRFTEIYRRAGEVGTVV
jgi:Nitrogen regulatory protein P-II